MLPTRRWKPPFQLNKCKGDANRSSFTTANKYLFADLLLFTSGEGDEATLPSFTAENSGIDVSSALLEALIATKQMQWGCEWERFTRGKQIPVCRSLLFKSGEGDEAPSPSFATR